MAKVQIMRTFHSIAYFAQSEGAGHFYHYHRAIQKAMELSGAQVTVYVPLNSHFDETPQGWKKWFSPFYNRRNRKKFWNDCKNLFRQKSHGERIFFIEFFGRRDFFLYGLAAFLYARKQDLLWTLYRDDLSIRRKKDLKVICLVSRLLQWRFKKRFLPLTDSELLADYYHHWFLKRPTVLPILYAPLQAPPPKAHTKIICSWLGAPRPEKGALEIAHLVQLQGPLSERIELEVSGATYFPPVKNQIQISLRKAFLTEEEYYHSLHRSDVVLLPYDPEKYRRRTSGVFVEAILAGKIPLVKAGSWLAYELNRFELQELIVDWNHLQFFSHLLSLVQDKTLIKKLHSMRQAYLAFHGEENFARSLHRLFEK